MGRTDIPTPYNTHRAAIAIIITVLLLPTVPLLIAAVSPPNETWIHLRETVLAGYVWNTVVLAVGSAAGAAAIGAGAAWTIERYDFPGRAVLSVLLSAPLAVPVYLLTFVYGAMSGYGGVLSWLTGGVPVAGPAAAILMFSLSLYPYVYLTVRGAMNGAVAAMLEVASCLAGGAGPVGRAGAGRRRWVVFRRGVLPLLLPAVAGGAGLVGMEVLNAYGTPVYLGVDTVATGIFRTWFGLGDLQASTRLAGYVLLTVVLLLAAEGRRTRRSRLFGVAAERELKRLRLNPVAATATVAVLSVPVVLGFGLPVVQLTVWAIPPVAAGLSVPDSGGTPIGPGLSETLSAIANSFLLAGGTAVLLIGLALVIAYVNHLHHSRGTDRLVRFATVGYAVPGTVLAIGTLVVFQRIAGVQLGTGGGLFLFGTVGGLVYAYAVRYLAVALRPLTAALNGRHRTLIDSARSLGISPLRTLISVVIPNIRATGVAVMAFVAVDVMKDLPMTLLLRPFNFDTSAVRVFNLASDERLPEAAGEALVLIAMGLLAVRFLTKGSRQDPPSGPPADPRSTPRSAAPAGSPPSHSAPAAHHVSEHTDGTH